MTSVSGGAQFGWQDRAIQRVSENGLLLKTEPEWCKDLLIVSFAVNENPLAIRYADAFKDNRFIAIKAVKVNGIAKMWLSEELQNDPEIKQLSRLNYPRTFNGQIKGVIRCKHHRDSRVFYALHTSSPLGTLQAIKDVNQTFNGFCLAKDYCSKFVRDSHVTLFNGEHLLPYSFQDFFVRSQICAMLPKKNSNLFISDDLTETVSEGYFGKGFSESNVDQAMIVAYDQGIPFKRGSTCIEGGNCFLFSSKGENKALVGEFSVLLSLLALDEQHLLDDVSQNACQEPSEEALRLARNMTIYQIVKKPQQEKKISDALSLPNIKSGNTILTPEQLATLKAEQRIELEYRKRLVAPLTETERAAFHKEAQLLEAKLLRTKELIAAELGVTLKNVAFMPQIGFHIDMELFVTPEGEVVLHDDERAVTFLDEIKKSSTFNDDELSVWTSYYTAATHGANAFKAIQQERQRILQSMSIDFKLIPCKFSRPSKGMLNFCNGLMLQKVVHGIVSNANGNTIQATAIQDRYVFITTGPSMPEERPYYDKFASLFHKTFPKIDLKPIPGMSSFIATYNGGVRCLTFENSLIFKDASHGNK